MIKYCMDKWNKNRVNLKKAIESDGNLSDCEYLYLVKIVVNIILNDDESDWMKWDAENITEIDNGDYQGTLLYLIPRKAYQPNEHDYLMTFVEYGSCSGCDTLQNIQSEMKLDWDTMERTKTENTIKDFMQLCKDLVCNMIMPYNIGWRGKAIFETVEYEGGSNND